VASYSAGRDIEAKLISEPSTGTKLDIAANDQIRPIATHDGDCHHPCAHLRPHGKLAGIISIGDVVKHRLEDLESETNVLRDAYMATR
jgi:hypothetical protein